MLQPESALERRKRILEYELEYGPDLERRRQALLLEVEAAFGDVRKGDGIGIREASQWEANYTANPQEMAAIAAARAADVEQKWQDVPAEYLKDLYTPFMWVDNQGFRFLIPAFIQYFLRAGWNIYDDSYDGIIEMTIRSLSGELYVLDDLQLTSQQILCMKKFIEWVVDCSGLFMDQDFVVELLDWCSARILTS